MTGTKPTRSKWLAVTVWPPPVDQLTDRPTEPSRHSRRAAPRPHNPQQNRRRTRCFHHLTSRCSSPAGKMIIIALPSTTK